MTAPRISRRLVQSGQPVGLRSVSGYYLGDSGAKVLFAWHAAAGEAAKGAAETGTQVIEVDEPDLSALLAGDDEAVIFYTSGTTGRPKGAELPHAGLIATPRSPRRPCWTSAVTMSSWAACRCSMSSA